MDGGSNNGRGALRHPLFLGALALLLINDHVLKGADVLPSALTGKLSDFAGLIVAPVFVAALFGARTRTARGLSFFAATLPFVAINVSPQMAESMVAFGAAIGLEWHVWCDPSDLVGLTMLPIAWWLLDAAPQSLPSRRVVEGVGLGAAAFACMATSAPPPGPPGEPIVIEEPAPDWQTVAYIHNGNTTDVDVRLRWVDAVFDCARVRTEPGAYLTLDAFGEGVTVTLDPNRNFPLSREEAANALEEAADWLPPRELCDAVLVQRDGSPDTVIYFEGAEIVAERHSDSIGPRGVEVGRGLRFTGAGDPDVVLSRLGETLGDADICDEADASLGFAFSVPGVDSGLFATVTGMEMLRDGCFEVSFEIDPEAEPFASYLCVPMWAFDLGVGDEVRFDMAGRERLTLTRLEAEDRPATRLDIIESGEAYDPELGLEVRPSATCAGGPTECGAYTVPAEVWLEGEGFAAGDEHRGYLADGRQYRLGVGSANETVVGVDGCEGAEREPGLQFNAVIFVEEVE